MLEYLKDDEMKEVSSETSSDGGRNLRDALKSHPRQQSNTEKVVKHEKTISS